MQSSWKNGPFDQWDYKMESWPLHYWELADVAFREIGWARQDTTLSAPPSSTTPKSEASRGLEKALLH